MGILYAKPRYHGRNINPQLLSLIIRNKYFRNENRSNIYDSKIAQSIDRGDYDDAIIKVFREHRIDVQRTISGASWENDYSAYRTLAELIEVDPSDNDIVREIYRVLIYNKRFIRDRIHTDQAISHDLPPRQEFETVNQVELHPIEDIIPIKKPSFKEPTPIKEEPKPPPPQPPPPRRPPPQRSVTPATPTRAPPKPIPALGRETVKTSCPRCNYHGNTAVQYKIGKVTWLASIGMALSGLCFPFAWVPFISPGTKDVMHICRQCRLILGIVHRAPCEKNQTWDWDKNDVETPSRYKNSKAMRRAKQQGDLSRVYSAKRSRRSSEDSQ